jgi:hypothetical protein
MPPSIIINKNVKENDFSNLKKSIGDSKKLFSTVKVEEAVKSSITSYIYFRNNRNSYFKKHYLV